MSVRDMALCSRRANEGAIPYGTASFVCRVVGMSCIYFIGDLHFGHKNISVFRDEFSSEGDHREHLIHLWNRTITKRDIVYVMGDAAFTTEGLGSIGYLEGTKILVRGNHDLLPTEAYLEHFQQVYGMYRYKGLWLTHAPIHPTELYGRSNVHGHCHRGGPMEVHAGGNAHIHATPGQKATYFNTCAEHLPEKYVPIELHAMMDIIKERIRNAI